jgi:hypothetical protein
LAKKLPNYPFDPISIHRAPDAAGHDDFKIKRKAGSFLNDDRKMGKNDFLLHQNYFLEIFTVKRTRFFRLRRARTLRPPGLFILFRNPCDRKRRFLWGWKVLFISEPLSC